MVKEEEEEGGGMRREQLISFFHSFSLRISLPEVKKRIADAVVHDNQEAVAVTTAIQEEILIEFGIDPRVGLACLGKVNTVFENDQELMIHFYRFVMKEELACEEAELGPDLFAEKMEMHHNLQQSQLEMLEHMRKFHLDDQSAILEKLHQQLEDASFDSEASVLTVEQVQDIVRRRVTPVYTPK